MRNIFLLILSLVSIHLFSQQVSFVLCDSEKKEPILYANIINKNTKTGSISDFEGICSIHYKSINDSLKISYIGYKSLYLSISDIMKSDTIFLKKGLVLEQVEVYAKNIDLAKELHQIITNSKMHFGSLNSKASLLVESYTKDNIPLERFEGIGNMDYSGGQLNSFSIKMGRFGQNSNYHFFTLTPDLILSDIDVFNYSYPNPLLITQASRKQIKKLFKLSRIVYQDYSIYQFESINGKQFSGEVTVYNSSNTIGKLSCSIENVPNVNLAPMHENDEVLINQLKYEIQFSSDYKLKFILKNQNISIVSVQHKLDIDNVIFLYNNDSKKTYYLPILDDQSNSLWSIYEKTSRFPFDQQIWDTAFVFAENQQANRSFEYFQTHGFVKNISQFISPELASNLQFHSKEWGDRITYSDFNDKYKELGININMLSILDHFDRSLISDYDYSKNLKIYSHINRNSNMSGLPPLFNLYLSPIICPVNIKNKISYSTSTPLWNKKHSYFFMEKDYTNLVAINLFYDWIKVKTIKYSSVDDAIQINRSKPEDFDMIFQEIYSEALNRFNLYFNDQQKNFKFLVDWNNEVYSYLKIDNLKEISKKVKERPTDFNMNTFINNSVDIGDVYMKNNNYSDALYYYNLAISFYDSSQENNLSRLELYKKLYSGYQKTDNTKMMEKLDFLIKNTPTETNSKQ